MTRVSPYPLRSSRTNKQKEPESPIQTGGAREWEDVRCVICMEPPHNAVLLHCSCSSKGCRPYMCDTSVRHSNCFKQYRRNSKNRLNRKTFKCPFCRGEVYEAMKVSVARKFMNAKSRSCSVDDCDFSGTYSKLNNHLKTEHPGFTTPRVNQRKQRMWEQMQRDTEYTENMTTADISHSSEVVHHQLPYIHPQHPLIQLSVHNLFGAHNVRTGFGVTNYAPALLPRLEFHAFTMLPSWTP